MLTQHQACEELRPGEILATELGSVIFENCRGQRIGGMGGRNVLESPGFDAATDRYEMRFSGGASEVRIDTL